MTCQLKEEGLISFFKRRKPIGVIRMSYYSIDQGTESRLSILKDRLQNAEENSFDEPTEFNFGEFKGLKWNDRKNTNPLIDGLYWGNGGVNPLFKKKMPSDPMEAAMVVSTLSTMLMYHWEFASEQVFIHFNYRTFYGQTEDSIAAMNKELATIENQLKRIQLID
jgi:hypothetical protein